MKSLQNCAVKHEDCCVTDAPNILAGWWHFFHLSKGESSCFHSTVSGDDWWKPSEVHFTIRNERAFWEMAGTPIYTFQQCIGELSRLQSEGPPIEPDKRTQSVWKSWHVPRWRGSDSGLKNHLATVSHLLVRNILSNCILQLPKRLEAQVSIYGAGGARTLSLAFVVSICFPISSPSSLTTQCLLGVAVGLPR